MGCYQFYNLKNPMEDKIQRLVNAANSTNAKAKEIGEKQLRELGLDNNGNPLKSASTKEAKPKAERKKREPKAKAEVKSGTPYNCDDLIEQAEQRKAKAKANAIKRANEPKKTDATKNKEAIEKAAIRVEKNVEKRVKKDEISFGEIKKLIAEYEDAIAKLKVLLAKAEGKMAKGGGVNAEEVEHILMKAQGVKEHHCGCGDKKMATGGSIKSFEKTHSEVLDYLAKHKFNISAFGKDGNSIKVDDRNFGIEDQNAIEKINPKINVSGSSNSNIWYIFMPSKMATGGGVDEMLYYVVGKKGGQLVDISELPMTKSDAERWVKEQGVENYYNNVDIIPYRGNKPRHVLPKFAKGGGVGKGYRIGELLILPKNMSITINGLKDRIDSNKNVLTTKWKVEELYTDSFGNERIKISNSKESRDTYLEKVNSFQEYLSKKG